MWFTRAVAAGWVWARVFEGAARSVGGRARVKRTPPARDGCDVQGRAGRQEATRSVPLRQVDARARTPDASRKSKRTPPPPACTPAQASTSTPVLGGLAGNCRYVGGYVESGLGNRWLPIRTTPGNHQPRQQTSEPGNQAPRQGTTAPGHHGSRGTLRLAPGPAASAVRLVAPSPPQPQRRRYPCIITPTTTPYTYLGPHTP
jgi:hypothetical protein